MKPFELDFPKTALDSWRNRIIKELKEDEHKIFFTDTIEEFSFDISTRNKEVNAIGASKKNNAWMNSCPILVSDEKTANQLALKMLMQGCDALYFIANDIADFQCEVLFNEIGLDYIQVCFSSSNESLIDSFLASDFGKHPNAHAIIDVQTTNWSKYIGNTAVYFSVNVFAWQMCGANLYQQVGIALSIGHELLIQNVAPEQIIFEFGVGSQYFPEIAKFKAFQALWDFIATKYGATSSQKILAHIGWANKSLKDPHTNLLRQTTEVMSAIGGSCDALLIHPYDALSQEGSSDFTHRMAANISNLLKEESYFDKVIDPMRGSYSVENCTQEIKEKAYSYFKELDVFQNVMNLEKLAFISKGVLEKQAAKIDQWKKGEHKLIGINLFTTENVQPKTWKTDLNYLEVPYLIYELQA